MKSADTRRLLLGFALVGISAPHAITGLLADVGWYASIGIDFDAWYLHHAYQSMYWFLMGIGLTILTPMWFQAIRRREYDSTSREIQTGDGGSSRTD